MSEGDVYVCRCKRGGSSRVGGSNSLLYSLAVGGNFSSSDRGFTPTQTDTDSGIARPSHLLRGDNGPPFTPPTVTLGVLYLHIML